MEFGKGGEKRGKKRKKKIAHGTPPLGKARDGSRPYHRAKYWAPLSRVGHKTPRKGRACKGHGDHFSRSVHRIHQILARAVP